MLAGSPPESFGMSVQKGGCRSRCRPVRKGGKPLRIRSLTAALPSASHVWQTLERQRERSRPHVSFWVVCSTFETAFIWEI